MQVYNNSDVLVLGTLGFVIGQHMHVQKIFYVTTLFH